MKPGALVTRVVIILLLAAVLIYLGVYIWQGFSDPYQLVVTYAYELDDDAVMDGVIVRSERRVEGQAHLAEVLPQEGERVSAGAAVARIYQNETALSDHREARNLELELEQLRYAMRRGDAVADAKELDGQLVSGLAQLKSQVSTGSLGELEEQGLNIRSLVVKRTSDAADGVTGVAQLQETAQAVESQLNALNASAAQGTQLVTVNRGGVFSGMADGLEESLTPERLETLTVQDLDRLQNQGSEADESALGKLITDSTWYYVAALDSQSAGRLTEGDRCDVAFSGDFNQEVEMTLERLGPDEDGRRLVVFSSDRYLNRVTLCRFLSARVIFERFTGVWVPDKALRVLDKDDGTTDLGVYTLVGRQAEFKRVEVVREGDGFFLVRGTDPNRKVLRPGDTIILSNRELYEGKVIA